jgi:hypothetical protein
MPIRSFIKSWEGVVFRTQEDVEAVLLHYILKFNETRLAPGVVVYKGHKETGIGVLLETFPVSGTRSTPEGASSFFHLGWDDLEMLAKRLNLSVTI